MTDPIRLPKPGSTAGNWGVMLNAFLEVEHAPDGTLKKAHGVGDYLGARTSTVIIPTGAPVFGAAFDAPTASLGASLGWSRSQPALVVTQTDGVYAVNLTVEWNDSGVAGSLRFVQVYADDYFHCEEQQSSATGVHTIQSLSMVMTLRKQQTMQVNLQQQSLHDLTPSVRLLVTKIANVALPSA
jgi:hypothetical protein